MKLTCRFCGGSIDIPEKVGFRDTCPSCDSYLHACVHCRFFVDGHCSEPAADRVSDPEGQNYCDWFMVVREETGTGDEKGTRTEAEELWRKLTKK